MIIKKWNTSLPGTDKWEEQYPKTVTNQIYDGAGTVVFDSNNKLKLGYLPDSVFDSLYFYQTATTGTLRNNAAQAFGNSLEINRSPIGHYFVATQPFTLSSNSTAELSTIYTRTFSTTNTSTTITTTGNTNNLSVGMTIVGAGIPTGATIASITNSTSLVMSAAATATNAAVSTQFQRLFQTSISGGEESNTYIRNFNLTNASTSVTGGDTNNLVSGMRVSGTGIQTGSTIASITDATTFVLSANATQTGTHTLTFNPPISPTNVPIETGDWFIITNLSGTGVSGNPYIATFAVVNNTYELMKAATSSAAGAPGLVPSPSANQHLHFLRGDGTWVIPTNTTYSAISEAEIDGTTDDTGRLITGRRANYLLRNNVTTGTTANLATGATVSATKVVNLGTGGSTGSTTNVNIGSSIAGTTTIASPTTTVSAFNATSGTFSVGATTGNVVSITGNSLTSGSGLKIESTAADTMTGSLLNVVGNGAITTGDLAKFSSTGYVGSTASGLVDIITNSTARATGSSSLYIASSGANGTASVNSIGEIISVKNTGTTSTNTGLSLDVSGASTNRAINVVAGDTVLQAMSATSGTFSAAISATGGTFSGDVAVNGGDITTTETTFGLIDTTATTVNAFGAATSLSLGNDGTGAASTTNIATGAISTTLTKAINIGTGGSGTSTTTITLGSATSSSQVIINSTDTQLRAASTGGNAATHFPVFTADPSTTGRLLRHRTAAQVLSDIGAAASSHTHTITANATDGIFDLSGTNGTNAVTYAVNAYTAGGTAGRFNTSTTAPTGTTRINWEGDFYATKIYAGSTELFNRVVEVNNTSIGTNTLDLKSGEGITVTASNGDVTFAQTYPVYHGDTLPTGTISNNSIGFEW